jgi:hypothetical protein
MALTFFRELLRVFLLCPALALQLAVGAFMSCAALVKLSHSPSQIWFTDFLKIDLLKNESRLIDYIHRVGIADSGSEPRAARNRNFAAGPYMYGRKPLI